MQGTVKRHCFIFSSSSLGESSMISWQTNIHLGKACNYGQEINFNAYPHSSLYQNEQNVFGTEALQAQDIDPKINIVANLVSGIIFCKMSQGPLCIILRP